MSEQEQPTTAPTEKKCHGHRGIGSSIVIAAAILGLFFYFAYTESHNNGGQVSVRGLCEREIKADRAIYPITFAVAGDNLESVFNTVQAQNETITSFLKENGITAEEYSISAPHITDHYAQNNYGDNYKTRYIITSVITIYSTNVDTVLALQNNLSKLIEKGLVIGTGNGWENPVQFLFEGLNDVKPQMIEEANNNARVAAEQFAKNSNSRLGKIKTATQGYFEIENRDSNTPHIKKVRVVTNITYHLK